MHRVVITDITRNCITVCSEFDIQEVLYKMSGKNRIKVLEAPCGEIHHPVELEEIMKDRLS